MDTDTGMATPQEHRTRWHCRRGLLELDLVLGRFMERHYPELDAAQRRRFDRLLELQDNDLWDLVAGRMECPDPEFSDLIDLLQEN